MKSKTYQKEGWFILEVENSVLGADADDNKKTDSEKIFSIYHNKDEADDKAVVCAKELTDFVDLLVQDNPEPTEEEINLSIEKILAKANADRETEKPANKAVRLKGLP